MSKRREKPKSYREGDWFAVPLRSEGFGIGRIVRANPESGILLGCFFGPTLDRVPTAGDVTLLRPQTAVLVARFGDLGLTDGSWPIIESSSLNRDEWPVPRFVRHDAMTGKSHVVTYDSDDPGEEISIRPSSLKEVSHLPKDGLSGHGAIELKLTKLLGNRTISPAAVQ